MSYSLQDFLCLDPGDGWYLGDEGMMNNLMKCGRNMISNSRGKGDQSSGIRHL